MKVGDLFKFGYIGYHNHHLNHKSGLYIGEAFIHRSDGVVVENHKVLMHGDTEVTTIDRGMLRWMEKIK